MEFVLTQVFATWTPSVHLQMEMRSVVAKLDSPETGKLVSVGILLNQFNKKGVRVIVQL